jgi:hypothetical protein
MMGGKLQYGAKYGFKLRFVFAQHFGLFERYGRIGSQAPA